MMWTIGAILVPALPVVAWIHRRVDSHWLRGLLWAAGITTFLPAYLAVGSVWITAHTGHILLGSGLDAETHPYASRFIAAFLSAAIPEEGYKFLLLLLWRLFNKKRLTPQEGIALGAMQGIGHALGENCQDLTAGIGMTLLSGTLKLLYLASLGTLMGYFMGIEQTREKQGRWFLLWAALIPICLHGLYDFGNFVGELGEPYFDSNRNPPVPVTLSLLFMVGIWLLTIGWAGRIIKKHSVIASG